MTKRIISNFTTALQKHPEVVYLQQENYICRDKRVRKFIYSTKNTIEKARHVRGNAPDVENISEVSGLKREHVMRRFRE